MCGIVGFIDRMNQNDKSKTLEEMMNTIVHRGPNDKDVQREQWLFHYLN